jgi:hypothetical protein
MRIRGHAELTTTELSDEILFHVLRHDGLIDWFLMIVAPAVAVWSFYLPSSWAGVVIFPIALLISSPIPYWLHGRTTDLRVNADGIVASGNLGNIFFRMAKITPPELRPIVWLRDGLHLNGSGRGQRFVIYKLDREQARCVADGIKQRLPEPSRVTILL